MRRKDWCWSVRAVYVLGKLSDVSGPGLEEAGRYSWHQSKIKHNTVMYIVLKNKVFVLKSLF